jgi:hypothetical protein
MSNRELGKLPRTALYGRAYSSAGMSIDRGCPWMTATNRCLGHVGGTAGENELGAACVAMVTSLARGCGRSSVTTCLVGKGRRPTAAPWVRGSNPSPCCCAVRGRSGGWHVTCDCHSPTLTARARREPAVPDAVRTQHGPRVPPAGGTGSVGRHGKVDSLAGGVAWSRWGGLHRTGARLAGRADVLATPFS